MSWGERSCRQIGKPCPQVAVGKCEMGLCNVDCPEYKWDGVTTPDSRKSTPPKPEGGK